MNISASPDAVPAIPVALPGAQPHHPTSDEANESQTLAAAVELLMQLDAIDNLETAAIVSGEMLRGFFQAQRVIIGWRSGAKTTCEVLCDTQRAASDTTDATLRKAEFALDEIFIRGRLTEHVTGATETRSSAQLTVKQFAEATGAETITGAPLLDNHGVARGAWMVVNARPQTAGPPTGYVVDAFSRPLGSRLSTIQRTEPNWLQKTLQNLNASVARSRTSVLVAVFLLIAFAVFYPVKYTVRCDCVLEPVTRRFISAPFDGSLEKSMVQPGDIVEENTMLARMSARELDWELAGLYAELQRSRKEQKVSIATQEYAESQISELESRRIQSQTQLLESRVLNLDIRSPIKGVVVTGDIKEVEGAPLKTGQTLFEIAPLGEMVVELLVPEEDFAYVTPEMPVRLRLSAFPTQVLEGVVQRVHPKAEVKEQQNVFVAEMRIQDPHAIYRPGMHGRAGIVSVRRPLVWVAFHKPWASFLMWLGW